MLTKNGICLKLDESEYKVLKYGLIFYFSSKLYLEKFVNNVEKYVEEETIKIKNKYKIQCDFELYLAISYYGKIEHRGFYIYDDVLKQKVTSNCLFTNTLSRC